jgi:hypothetical membrane protein
MLVTDGLHRENIIGFIGPLVSFVCILIATLILPSFNWASNALSDLGSWFRTDLGGPQIASAILFNSGLIITGLLLLYFNIWLIRQFRDLPSRIGLLFFVGSSVLLTGIGIFSEDFSFFHFWTAVPFFFSIPFALGVTGMVWLRFAEMRVSASLLIILAFLSLVIMFQPWIVLSTAVFEILEAVVIMLGVWLINITHIQGKMKSISS